MKAIIAVLVILLLALQYKLWVQSGGIVETWQLAQEAQKQQNVNKNLEQRNQALAAEVKDLKQGKQAIEERARNQLGMIKNDEKFYYIID